MKFVWFGCCFWHNFIELYHQRQNFEIFSTHFILNLFCFDCCRFVSQEYSKPRWERSASKWDANKVTQPHKRLKMKREWDKGNERQGNLMGLWQSSCLIWNHLRFHGWGVVSWASGSGPQMDYSKSNHNTWIWDAFCASECSFLFCHILCLSISICLSSF